MTQKYKKLIDPKTGKASYVRLKPKPKKIKPDSPKALIQAINRGQAMDRRTTAGRQIGEVRDAVHENLDGTARALLEQDVANAAIITQACVKAAFRDPDKMIAEDGKLCSALYSWLKFSAAKRSALLALKKFQPPKEKPKPEGDLGDMVLEVSSNDVEQDRP